ncbi:DUF58 domain-containing protein [Frankia sp. AgB1.9]|uniref:DUF58 domain-containing protein n=1 Tax=unclassified Frankia TaxID=2632575 RepID=UPI001931DB66|nr:MULTISPECIES: DUF58 domain-containing protein [unclassified Frankia]MBL7491367.1 DUF58 domain-containing protein [Frankia sp. AgW1.1]MBL7554119.1 DUF58 domain-containing protein [Frankia sp. AgB1.9]MBL7618449.1 DUF58 domain-containing protein [Frankia sp. AgB1.8]
MITRSGIAVAVVGVAFVAAGLALHYPELIVIAAAAFCALLVAGGWLLFSPDVTIAREVRPARVVQGEPAFGYVTVTNVSRRRCPPILADERVAGASLSVAIPSLAPGGQAERGYPIPTGRRGIFEVGPLTVGHSDPLRLVYVGQTRPERSVLRVRPRVHVVPPLPTGGSPDLDGPTSNVAPQGGIAFHSLREYARGDDLRLVHWPSTAKTGTLMVRHNVVPNEPTMMVLLDTSAAPYTEDFFEDAVRVAASLAVSGRTHGFPVELVTSSGQRVAAGRGAESVDAALDLLAGVAPSPEDPGLAALPGLAPRQPGSVLGVVTGQPAAEKLAAVSTVRQRFSMVSVVQVGEIYGRPGRPVGGAMVVNVRTSDEFAAVWAARAHR